MIVDNYSLSRSEWEEVIERWIIGRHAERDKQILKRRLLDGVIFEALAEEFDLSTRQVQNIVYKRQRELYKKI